MLNHRNSRSIHVKASPVKLPNFKQKFNDFHLSQVTTSSGLLKSCCTIPPTEELKTLLPANWIKTRPAACQTIKSQVA
jgi:hypothetical protein